MRLFRRSMKSETSDESWDEKENLDETQLEKIMESLVKDTPKNNYYEDPESVDLMNSISDKIKMVKEEYDNAISELVPVKWELIEKKSEIDEIKSEYSTLLLQLKSTKDELHSMKSEISNMQSQIDAKRAELLNMQSENTHDGST